jgi:integral membrane protein
MAWVVGTMLIAVFVAIPFQSVEKVIGPIHGVLYILYLATVVNMLIVYRLGFWYFVGMVVAGWLPFLSFIVERLISRRLARTAAGYTDAPTFESELEP